MKPVECPPDKATAKTPRRGHEPWWGERLFDCIASNEQKQLSFEPN